MNESIDPASSNTPLPTPNITPSGSESSYKTQTADSKDKDGESHVVMGMTMDKKQYDAFMKNLSDTVLGQIKQDEADYNQTQQEIRQEEELEDNG